MSLEEVGLAEVALRIFEERAANVATNSASGLSLATSVVEAIALFPAPNRALIRAITYP